MEVLICYPSADIKSACDELPKVGDWWNGYRVQEVDASDELMPPIITLVKPNDYQE